MLTSPAMSESTKPKRRGKQLTAYIDPDVHKRLKLHATEEEEDMQVIVERVLREYLDGLEGRRPRRKQ
jgi:predicted HicB family RNase H-like nuclease